MKHLEQIWEQVSVLKKTPALSDAKRAAAAAAAAEGTAGEGAKVVCGELRAKNPMLKTRPLSVQSNALVSASTGSLRRCFQELLLKHAAVESHERGTNKSIENTRHGISNLPPVSKATHS